MGSKAHIQYLDVLKGVIIFLVVVGHAFHFGFEYYRSTLLYVLRSIDMPIFLFLSGMLSAGALSFSAEGIRGYWLKKARQLLLPLCTLPFLYALVYDIELRHLLLDRMHGGYWFTLTLFEMFALLYIVRASNRLVNKGDNPWIEVGLAALSLAFVQLVDAPWERLHPSSWEALSWGKMNYLYQYFLLGYFAGRYQALERLISSTQAQAVAALVFFACIYRETTAQAVLGGIPASISGLIMAYATAKRLGNGTSRLNAFWAYLGRESRTIYLTHYFLLFSLPAVGKYLKGLPNDERIFLIEALCASAYALVVIGATLLLVRMLRSNAYLDTLFYGKRLPQPAQPATPIPDQAA